MSQVSGVTPGGSPLPKRVAAQNSQQPQGGLLRRASESFLNGHHESVARKIGQGPNHDMASRQGLNLPASPSPSESSVGSSRDSQSPIGTDLQMRVFDISLTAPR